MSIKNLIDKIANIFNYTFVNKNKYNELLEIINNSQNNEEHAQYIKYWVIEMGCDTVYINNTPGYAVDIYGNKLTYCYEKDDKNDSDAWYYCNLYEVEIPESFKKEILKEKYNNEL